jgi:Rod binding domain-containing protein
MTDHTRENDVNKVAAGGLGLADILIEQAMREQAIISKMTQAVQDGDKDRVFQLAREITCVMSVQQ